MKGLILGTVKGLPFEKIYPWAKSAVKTGNKVVLISMENNEPLVLQMKGIGVEVVTTPIDTPKDRSPHNERFLLQYNYLNQAEEDYAVITDVRDVIFQTNPIDWLHKNLTNHQVVCSSEGLLYKDEPWGDNNLKQGYPYLYEEYKNRPIMNVGVIGGKTKALAGISLMIYTMCRNNPAYLSDQSSFNILCGMSILSNIIYKSNSEAGWSLNAGTFIREATGGIFKLNETTKHILLENEPINDNGIFKTHDGKIYSIVHQWDRVPNYTIFNG